MFAAPTLEKSDANFGNYFTRSHDEAANANERFDMVRAEVAEGDGGREVAGGDEDATRRVIVRHRCRVVQHCHVRLCARAGRGQRLLSLPRLPIHLNERLLHAGKEVVKDHRHHAEALSGVRHNLVVERLVHSFEGGEVNVQLPQIAQVGAAEAVLEPFGEAVGVEELPELLLELLEGNVCAPQVCQLSASSFSNGRSGIGHAGRSAAAAVLMVWCCSDCRWLHEAPRAVVDKRGTKKVICAVVHTLKNICRDASSVLFPRCSFFCCLPPVSPRSWNGDLWYFCFLLLCGADCLDICSTLFPLFTLLP